MHHTLYVKGEPSKDSGINIVESVWEQQPEKTYFFLLSYSGKSFAKDLIHP